jgi:hypothetical protein
MKIYRLHVNYRSEEITNFLWTSFPRLLYFLLSSYAGCG